MKKFLSLALILTLLSGTALAQTNLDERAALGAWTADVYEDQSWHPSWKEETVPYVMTETHDKETGLTAWTFDPSYETLDPRALRTVNWLPQRGIAAEAAVDFDGDGAAEWVVLTSRENADHEAWTALYLSVYEAASGNITLADEICIASSPIDMAGEMIELFFMNRGGETVLFSAGAYSVDSVWHENWVISYKNGKLHADAGLLSSRDETGAWYVHSIGACDAAEIAGMSPWELPEGSKTHRFSYENASTFATQYALSAEAIGVTAIADKTDYLYSYAPIEGEKTVLFRLNVNAEDAEGNPLFIVERKTAGRSVVTVGAMNMRSTPSLTGETIEIIGEGETLEFLSSISTDERGIDWYLVRSEENEGWVSSKFALFE
ncbi:MAG: SH3 domain-containing protein [Clostridia bacterium]|nr:SH3 domain-containing protein [Clostridia bacterium]